MPTEPIDIPIRTPGATAAQGAIRGVGTASLGAVVGVTALASALAALAATGIAKFAADYEEALIGVAKTTGLGDAAIDSLSIAFRQLSREIPISAKEIAGIGQIAGQLGIQSVADIEAFTETVAKIASVTDFATQAAGESLARLSNIFALPIEQVGKLGSALNELENTTTANAPTIANFTQRLAVASSQLGLSVADTAGLSATLVDLGFKAELAGTAISKTFTEMIKDVSGFADQLGVTSDEFKVRLEEDAIGTIVAWGEAINDLPRDEMIKAFEDIGIEGARAISVFGALTTRTELLSKNVETANKAFKEGTSLQEEFEIAVKATNAQFQLAKNDLADITLGLGEGLLPTVTEAIQQFREWIESLELTEEQLRNVGQFIAGFFVEAINAGVNAVGLLKSAFSGIASLVLAITANISLLAIPIANLSDLIGFTDTATEDLLANIAAMEGASIELANTMKQQFTEATTGPGLLKLVIADLSDAIGKIGGQTEDLELINELFRQGRINADEASKAIQRYVDAGAGRDVLSDQIAFINDLFLRNSISALNASKSIQRFVLASREGAEVTKVFAKELGKLAGITIDGQTFFGINREEIEKILKFREQIKDFGGVNTGNAALTPDVDAFNFETGNLILEDRVTALTRIEEVQRSVNDSLKQFNELQSDLLRTTGFFDDLGELDVASLEDFERFIEALEEAGVDLTQLNLDVVLDRIAKASQSAGLELNNIKTDSSREELRALKLSIEALGFFDDPKEELRLIVEEIKKVGFSAGKTADEIQEAVDRARIKFGELKAEEDPILDSLERIARGTETSITNAFVDAVKGMDSFQEAFSRTIDAIIAEIIRLAIVRPFIESLFGSPSTGGGGIIGNLITAGIQGLFGGGGSGIVASGSVSSLPLAPSFSHGTDFVVPGSGGRDSKLFQGNVTPGERITISTPGQRRSGGGVFNEIGITVNVEPKNGGGNDEGATDFGFEIANSVKSIIVDMMRPGQPLANVDKGKS